MYRGTTDLESSYLDRAPCSQSVYKDRIAILEKANAEAVDELAISRAVTAGRDLNQHETAGRGVNPHETARRGTA